MHILWLYAQKHVSDGMQEQSLETAVINGGNPIEEFKLKNRIRFYFSKITLSKVWRMN